MKVDSYAIFTHPFQQSCRVGLMAVLIILSVIVRPGLAQQTEPRSRLSDEDLAAWGKISAKVQWFTPSPWGELLMGSPPANDSWHGFSFHKCSRFGHFDKQYHLKSLDEVAVPSVPFALSILAPGDDLKKLPRFRDQLQALIIEADSHSCNYGTGGYEFLQPLTQLRVLSFRESAGDGLFHAISGHKLIESLQINGRWITDAGLTELAKLKQLKTLRIAEAEQITPAGIKEIATLSNLRSLDLGGSAINDEALAYLTALTDLEILNLSATRITDAGAENLSQFTRLQTLVLGRTKIKQEILGRLKVQTINWTPFYTSGARQSERDGALAAQTIWNGRTLGDWFNDVTDRSREGISIMRAEDAKMDLIAAAAKEPDVCRVALQHVGRGNRAVENRLHRILVANRENAHLAACERLSDEIEDERIDQWCINYLREQKDTSTETIAALVACLHSKKKSGEGGDGIAGMAAVRLGEIGLPAIDAILNDRLRGTPVPWWNQGSLELMGIQAADRVLEHSLAHPEDFLNNVLATYCRDNAAEVAPKLLSVLADEKLSKHHAIVLATLATAGETYYRDSKRIDPILNAEDVVSAALPFLRQNENYASSMKIIVGWRPHPEGTKEQVIAAFIAGHDDWLSGVKALGTLDEIPAEVAEPLFQLHEQVPPNQISHWQIAIGKLSAEGKEKIRPALRASARTSPAAAVGLATVDPSQQTGTEVRAILNEMKQDETLRPRIEAYLRQALNL